MPFIPPETIEKARQVDLLTYLQTCELNELVHLSGGHYCTREHDSLKISNGKWYWFSRGFGGYNALDYLIKVTVTLIYEDETGQEYQQETQFETTVNRPVVEVPQTASGEDAEEKAAGQWWISVLILGGVILAAGFGFVLIKRKKKNRGGAYL